MLPQILIGLALIFVLAVVIILIIASTKPAECRVTRSGQFNAPPEKVFEHLSDFQKWEAWSPWAKMDTNVKNSFTGTPASIGSTFSWSGNNKVGTGTMTLLESNPSKFLKLKLQFERPMKCTNSVDFTLTNQNSQTHVTWSMYGPNLFIGKVMSIFMDMDKMVGKDFEKGLENLRAVVEAGK